MNDRAQAMPKMGVDGKLLEFRRCIDGMRRFQIQFACSRRDCDSTGGAERIRRAAA
jgi:hypothetical protein